jgi:hypothetical protein
MRPGSPRYREFSVRDVLAHLVRMPEDHTGRGSGCSAGIEPLQDSSYFDFHLRRLGSQRHDWAHRWVASSVSLLSCGVRGWKAVVVASQLKRPVMLSVRDREELIRLTTTGVRPASVIRRARVLLALDISVGEPDPKEVIAARLGVSGEMLRLVAKRFAETGGDVLVTISRRKRDLPPVPSPVTGEVEARLIALACSQPPEGYARWSLRLLEKHVELTEDIPNLDHSTIGRVLKKRNCVLI